MAEKNRASQMKRGLSFTFTILTWVTVAPAVLVGLTATGLFAFFALDVPFETLRFIAIFGASRWRSARSPGR